MTKITEPVSAGRSDRIGKLFLVLTGGIRQCLVCEQLFSSPAAAEHALLRCMPNPALATPLVIPGATQ